METQTKEKENSGMTTFQVMHAPQVFSYPKSTCKICRTFIEIDDLRVAEDMVRFPAWHHIDCFKDHWGHIKGNRNKLHDIDQIRFHRCCTEEDREIIAKLFDVSVDQCEAITQMRAPLVQNLEAFATSSAAVPISVCPATPERAARPDDGGNDPISASPAPLSVPVATASQLSQTQSTPLPPAAATQRYVEELPVFHVEPRHPPTEEQRTIIDAVRYLAGTTEKRKMRVIAGPGTGKTKTIVDALLALDPASANGVILPAFSKAATETLNTRLQSHGFPAADPARTLHSITSRRLGLSTSHPIIEFGGTNNLIFPKKDEKFAKKPGTPQLRVRFNQQVQDAAINVLGSALASSCELLLTKMCGYFKRQVTKKFETYLQCTEPDLKIFLQKSHEKASTWEGQDAYLQRTFTRMCEKLRKDVRQKCLDDEILSSWVSQFKKQLPLLCEAVLPSFWSRYVDWSSNAEYRDSQTGETTFFWTHDMKPKAVHIQLLKRNQQLNSSGRPRLISSMKDDAPGIVIVDEAQDLTPLQFDLIEKLFPHKSLLVVGDPVQSIMGFRGAQPWMFETTFQPSAAVVSSSAHGGEDAEDAMPVAVPMNFDLCLSTTFRFGSAIADIHNRFLQLRHESCLDKGRKMPSHCFQMRALNHGGFVGTSPKITNEGLQRFLIDDALPKLLLDRNARKSTQMGELCFIGRQNASAIQVALRLLELTASHPKEIGNKVKLQLKLNEKCIDGFVSKYCDLLAFLMQQCDVKEGWGGEGLGFDHMYFKGTKAAQVLRGRLVATPKNEVVEGLENYVDWWSLVHNDGKKKKKKEGVSARASTDAEADDDDPDASLLPEDALSVVQHIHNALLAAAHLDSSKNEHLEAAEAATRNPELVLATINQMLTVLANLQGRTSNPFYSAASTPDTNSRSEDRVTLSVSISHQAKGKEVLGVVVLEDEFLGCPVMAAPSSSIPAATTATAAAATRQSPELLFDTVAQVRVGETPTESHVSTELAAELQTLKSDELGTFYVAMTRAKEFLWIPQGMQDVMREKEEEDVMALRTIITAGDEDDDEERESLNSISHLGTTTVDCGPESSRGKRNRDE